MIRSCIIIFLISFFTSLVLGKITIPLLRKLKAGQNVLSYVKEHSEKNGTSTMGGLFFIVSAIVISCLFFKGDKKIALFSLAICFSYMVVGFLDDFIKIKNKRNLGLKAYQKIIFQGFISIFCGVFCLKNGLTFIYVPFTQKLINVGNWIIPFSIIVFLATTNCVNLTDGLDGLAGNTSMLFLFFTAVLIGLQTKVNPSVYLIKEEYYNLINCCVAFCGAILGFLVFNTYNASVFMGDTGSLGLGGIIACVSIFSGNMLTIAVIGFVFVLSGLSVILQVVYFKITKGKRIFLMAPFHHHLQHKGLSESKIVFIYSMITLIMGLFSIFIYV